MAGEDNTIADHMTARLASALSPSVLKIEDVSWQHAGHAGARPGGQSHFNLEIAAPALDGLSGWPPTERLTLFWLIFWQGRFTRFRLRSAGTADILSSYPVPHKQYSCWSGWAAVFSALLTSDQHRSYHVFAALFPHIRSERRWWPSVPLIQ